jgi:hypothetical protein
MLEPMPPQLFPMLLRREPEPFNDRFRCWRRGGMQTMILAGGAYNEGIEVEVLARAQLDNFATNGLL